MLNKLLCMQTVLNVKLYIEPFLRLDSEEV